MVITTWQFLVEWGAGFRLGPRGLPPEVTATIVASTDSCSS
jgi:hypothetical protein